MRSFDKNNRNGADHRLSHIELADGSFSYEGVSDGVRVWTSPDGDPIGLFLLNAPPDLPRAQASVEAFSRQYRSRVDADFVELDIDEVDGVRVVRTIAKVPQSLFGMTYVGTITFPFRNFSYVLKIVCEEVGITGVREAIILNKALARDDNSASESAAASGDLDPDSEAYDSDFPDHPLSRCRRSMGLIETSACVSDQIRQMDTLALPSGN